MNVKKAELAPLLGISIAALNKHIHNGMPGRRGTGAGTTYDVAEVFQWFVEFQIQQALKNVPKTQDSDIEHSKAQYEYWRSERMKHKALVEQKVLVTIDDAEERMTHRLGQIRDVLLNLPITWSPYVVGITTEPEAQRVLTSRVEDMMTVLSTMPETIEDDLGYPHEEDSSLDVLDDTELEAEGTNDDN